MRGRRWRAVVPAVAAALLLAPAALFADRSSAFGVDAFNEAVPADAPGSAAFSPLGFELDCCILAEAFDSIGRANVAETMGVLSDFAGVYQPILDGLGASATNGLSFLSARALCLPDPEQASLAYRRTIWELNGASVCLDFPSRGAACWLRAKMDGEMEDFEPPVAARPDRSRYRFFDLVSVRLAPGGEGPAATVAEAAFRDGSGAARRVPFLRVRRRVAYCRSAAGLAVRLPLAGGADLYLFTPPPGEPLADLRRAVTGAGIRELLAGVLSVTERDCGTVWADVALPVMDFTTRSDLTKPLILAKVAQTGFAHLDGALTRRDAAQYVRLRLGADGSGAAQAADGEPAPAAERTFTFDTPFLFFVHLPDVDAMPVAGQFTGQFQGANR